ncbi:hypothetical protein D9619_010161 [Psilocybe cf. subviscida]|uniref:Uncharacterized protein n=1 Tax=Psilocybe cf. subviscida TaxID=2480587 RepID=A0A8H5ES25_9AGAR|nr:hypothetical protein D9619_010161 [Psilocybe cf. subviscida]
MALRLSQTILLQHIEFNGSSSMPWERLFEVSTTNFINTALGVLHRMLLPPRSLCDTLKCVAAHERRNTWAIIGAPAFEMLFKKVGTPIVL